MAGSRGTFDDAADSLAGFVIIMTLVALVLFAWVMVRAAHSIFNAFALTPRSRLLWILLAAVAVFVALAFITGAPAFLFLAGLAFAILAISSQAVVLSHQAAFDEPRSSRQFMDEVLTDWWPEAA